MDKNQETKKMVEIELDIDTGLIKEMNKHPSVDWTGIAIRAFEEKLKSVKKAKK